jgi:predicted nucleotide-binding protein
LSQHLPYNGTPEGEVLRAIVINKARYWQEIQLVTNFNEDKLNETLTKLYSDGIIKKTYDDSYWIIPYDVYRAYLESSKDSEVSDTIEKKKRVFIVHGRNIQARNALCDFLTTLELHPTTFMESLYQTGEGTPYPGHVLDTAFRLTQAVVVLMTPDDESRLREPYRQPDDPSSETELTPQARPNVIYEAGMAMGISPKHTIIVELGKSELFSDIRGRHTVRLDNSIEKRRDLAKRLRMVGCPVSLSHKKWITTGDFENCLPKEPSEVTIPSLEKQAQQNVKLLDEVDISKVNITSDLINTIYVTAQRKALNIYPDAKLSLFTVQAFPYEDPRILNIYFIFYSELANRRCSFCFSDREYKITHHTPDEIVQFEINKFQFTNLPWNQSPNFLEFLDWAYIQIKPLTPVKKTDYHLNAYPPQSRMSAWTLRFFDGYTGRPFLFHWDGTEINNTTIKRL